MRGGGMQRRAGGGGGMQRRAGGGGGRQTVTNRRRLWSTAGAGEVRTGRAPGVWGGAWRARGSGLEGVGGFRAALANVQRCGGPPGAAGRSGSGTAAVTGRSASVGRQLPSVHGQPPSVTRNTAPTGGGGARVWTQTNPFPLTVGRRTPGGRGGGGVGMPQRRYVP